MPLTLDLNLLIPQWGNSFSYLVLNTQSTDTFVKTNKQKDPSAHPE